jgi:hypothetical protein
MTPCHICAAPIRDGSALWLHFEAEHPNDMHRINTVVIDRPLPVIEVDIDRIHASAIVSEKAAKALHDFE